MPISPTAHRGFIPPSFQDREGSIDCMSGAAAGGGAGRADSLAEGGGMKGIDELQEVRRVHSCWGSSSAVQAALRFSDIHIQGLLLEEIAQTITPAEGIPNALDIALKITDPPGRKSAIWHIFQHTLSDEGTANEVIRVVECSCSEEDKKEVLGQIHTILRLFENPLAKKFENVS